MTRRLLVLFVLCCLGLTAAFAGGGKEAEAAPAGGSAAPSGTVDWVTWWGEGWSRDLIDQALVMFNEEYPDIRINFISLPFGEARKEMIQRHAAGNDADLLSMNMPWLQDYLAMDMLEPLDDYIANDPLFPAADLVQTPMQKVNGHTWMVPHTVTYFCMAYNRKMLADAGYSNPPRTWNEFREIAAAVTDPARGRYGVSLMMDSSGASNGPILTVYPMLYTTGSTTVKNGQPNIDTPEMIKTLTFFNDLYNDGSILPGVFTKSGNQTTADLAAGTAAMIIMPSEHPGIARSGGLGDDVWTAKVPIPDQNGYDIARLHGIELSIASGSRNKDAAWTFLSWLVQEEPNLWWAQNFSSVPANTAVADRYSDFLSNDPLNQEVYRNMLELDFVEELMMTPKSGDTWLAFTEEMQRMFLGEQTPRQTAAAIQERWEEIFASAM